MFGRDAERCERLTTRPDLRRSLWSPPEMLTLEDSDFEPTILAPELGEYAKRAPVTIVQVFAIVEDHDGRSQTSASCGHCGYGDNKVMLVSLVARDERRLFALVRLWSGCLTYDMDDRDSTLWYSDSPEDLLETCADDVVRAKIMTTIDHSRVKIHREQLIEILAPIDLVALVLDYLCLFARSVLP